MNARGMLARGIGGEGRPLRFLMLVVGGWSGARIALLWPDPALDRVVAARRIVAASPVRQPASAPLIALGSAARRRSRACRCRAEPRASPSRAATVPHSWWRQHLHAASHPRSFP